MNPKNCDLIHIIYIKDSHKNNPKVETDDQAKQLYSL